MPEDYDVYEHGNPFRVGQLKARSDGGFDVYKDGEMWRVGELRPAFGWPTRRSGADDVVAAGAGVVLLGILALGIAIIGAPLWVLSDFIRRQRAGLGEYSNTTVVVVTVLLLAVTVWGFTNSG